MVTENTTQFNCSNSMTSFSSSFVLSMFNCEWFQLIITKLPSHFSSSVSPIFFSKFLSLKLSIFIYHLCPFYIIIIYTINVFLLHSAWLFLCENKTLFLFLLFWKHCFRYLFFLVVIVQNKEYLKNCNAYHFRICFLYDNRDQL